MNIEIVCVYFALFYISVMALEMARVSFKDYTAPWYARIGPVILVLGNLMLLINSVYKGIIVIQ